MHKKTFFSLVLLISTVLASHLSSYAKMLTLEEGLYGIEPGTFQIDIADIYAGYDAWTFTGDTRQYKYGRAIQDMGIRYTLLSSMEISLGMQYMYWQQRVDGVDTAHKGGFGQAHWGIKFSLGPALAAGVEYFNAAVAPEKELGGGADIKSYAVLESGSYYMNFAYIMTGEYTVKNPLTDEATTYDPGEVISGGMGFKIGKGNLMLICELRGTSFAENKVNGGEMADTAGLTLDVIGGLILQLGKLKVKAGVGIGVGDENFRGPGISPARYHDVSYDISPVLGITYFLK